MKIAVLGAGSWGTALGQVLNENGHQVLLWHLEQDFVDKINQCHIHPFLPGINLNNTLQFTASLDQIADYGEVLVTAIPSQIIRSDLDNNLIFVKGSIPGSKNSIVLIKKTSKSINRTTTQEKIKKIQSQSQITQKTSKKKEDKPTPAKKETKKTPEKK